MGIASKFRPTVGAKLIGLIAVLLLTSIVAIVWLSTRLFIEDNTALIQQTNAGVAENLSGRVRDVFEGVRQNLTWASGIMQQESVDPAIKKNSLQDFFKSDPEYLGVYLIGGTPDEASSTYPTLAYAVADSVSEAAGEQGREFIARAQATGDFSIEKAARGEPQVVGFEAAAGVPAVAVAAATRDQEGKTSFVLLGIVKQSKFAAAFLNGNDLFTSYLVDRTGRLLAHPEETRALNREDVSQLPIVKQMLEGKFNNGQVRYLDTQANEVRLGAFRLVGVGGLGVVAYVAEAKAFEAAKRIEYRSMLVAFVILCLSFLAGYIYSGSITWPIRQLHEASRKITAGDFNIQLKPKGRDEVAELSLAFNDMARGLEERDKVKAVFNKFHNKEIVDKLLSGEVKLGGERKEAVIFFSDVRGFTAMSESMDPEQVVEMLNEYMTSMVSIIRHHGGVVDKYVGDAIMALWGVPLSQGNDAENAVRACVAMREELHKLNTLRISRGQGVLKIGMGLNSGSVIAGNIGSEEKMEYTVIGDSVNLASRIESMTKEYGTDLLISKSIQEKTQGKFVLEQVASAKVKGKSQAVEIYKVRGLINEQGQEILVETPYSSYEAEKSDKAVHDQPAPVQVVSSPEVPPLAELAVSPPVLEVSPPPVVMAPKPPRAPAPVEEPVLVAQPIRAQPAQLIQPSEPVLVAQPKKPKVPIQPMMIEEAPVASDPKKKEAA